MGIYSFLFNIFLTDPFDGGWQYKNIFGSTNEVLLFDGGKCWIYDSGDHPFSVSYKVEKKSSDSYRVTFIKDGGASMAFLISFKDKDTINLAAEGSTDVNTMTRIGKPMAKSIMGIN